MRTISLFRRIPGALALGASVCTLSLAATAGTATAAVITIADVAYSAPQKGQGVNVQMPNSCYMSINDPPLTPLGVVKCLLIDPTTNAPTQWKAGEEGELVLLESGQTLPANCVTAAGAPDPACSDVVRFVNVPAVGGQAQIVFFTDNTTTLDMMSVPALSGAGPFRRESSTESSADAGIAQTKRSVVIPGTSAVRVRIQSNIPASLPPLVDNDILLAWY